jgi:hypothetical protein
MFKLEDRDRPFGFTLKTEKSDRGRRPQKGCPANRTGHTLRIAAQYIQKTPKNNGLLAGWLTDFRPNRADFDGSN